MGSRAAFRRTSPAQHASTAGKRVRPIWRRRTKSQVILRSVHRSLGRDLDGGNVRHRRSDDLRLGATRQTQNASRLRGFEAIF